MKPRSTAAICVLFCLGALLMIVLLAIPVAGDDGTQPPQSPQGDPKIKGPWLINGNDVGRMDVLFETKDSVKDDDNYVEFFCQTEKVYPCDASRSHYDWPFSGRRLWRFTITGLVQKLKLDYRIEYSDHASDLDPWSVGGSFWTAPVDVEPDLVFLAYGDTRSTPDGLEAVKQVAKHMAAEINESPLNAGNPNFVIHTGDFVFDGGRMPFVPYPFAPITDNWADAFFGVSEVEDLLKNLPIFTTLGNHDRDCGDNCHAWWQPGTFDYCDDNCNSAWPYVRHFPYETYDGRVDPNSNPDRGKLYYSFDWGPAHFFSLTTYPMDGYCAHSYPMEAGSDQLKWFEAELEKIEGDQRPWKIVFFHGPPYDPAGGSGCNQQQVRDNLVPLLEKYGVGPGHVRPRALLRQQDLEWHHLSGSWRWRL